MCMFFIGQNDCMCQNEYSFCKKAIVLHRHFDIKEGSLKALEDKRL